VMSRSRQDQSPGTPMGLVTRISATDDKSASCRCARLVPDHLAHCTFHRHGSTTSTVKPAPGQTPPATMKSTATTHSQPLCNLKNKLTQCGAGFQPASPVS